MKRFKTRNKMLKSKQYKELKKILELEFCVALNKTPQCVTDAMSSAPCYLGSEKYFESLAWFIFAKMGDEK